MYRQCQIGSTSLILPVLTLETADPSPHCHLRVTVNVFFQNTQAPASHFQWINTVYITGANFLAWHSRPFQLAGTQSPFYPHWSPVTSWKAPLVRESPNEFFNLQLSDSHNFAFFGSMSGMASPIRYILRAVIPQLRIYLHVLSSFSFTWSTPSNLQLLCSSLCSHSSLYLPCSSTYH